MRHRVSGKQLGRTGSHRKAMRRNMVASLFQHGAIRTTEAKAKELRRFAEKLITMAREGTLHARRRVIALMQDRHMTDDEGEFEDQTVVQKLFSEIAPRYGTRPGGYTRIIRLSDRRIGDAGTQVVLQLVEESSRESAPQAAGPSRRRRRAAKRQQAAESAEERAADQTTPQKPQADQPVEDDQAAENQDQTPDEPQDEQEQDKVE